MAWFFLAELRVPAGRQGHTCGLWRHMGMDWCMGYKGEFPSIEVMWELGFIGADVNVGLV